MRTVTAEDLLAERGWDVRVYDLCWLDCAKDGYHLLWEDPSGTRLHICLCSRHALALERGSWNGDYTGAPLPEETRGAEWPWQDQDVAA
jgi:hypothetical protein